MNPWRTMWISPRATIAAVVAKNPDHGLWPLAAIYGFSGILNFFQSTMWGDSFSAVLLTLMAIIFCSIWGYVLFSFWGWLLAKVGKWLKGQGSFRSVRAAYAWSCIPLSANVVIWLLQIAFLGRQVFVNYNDSHLLSQWMVGGLFILAFAKMGFVVWSIVLYLYALAEVQKFSILRAIFNVIIALALVGIIFAVLTSVWIGLTHMKGVST